MSAFFLVLAGLTGSFALAIAIILFLGSKTNHRFMLWVAERDERNRMAAARDRANAKERNDR